MDDFEKTMNKIKDAKMKKKRQSIYYNCDSFWSYFNRQSNFRFGIIIGPRKCGKTYLVQEHFLRDWTRCHDNIIYWYRLTEDQKKKMLANNAEKLFEPALYDKYLKRKGYTLKTNGDEVFACKTDKDGRALKKGRIKIAEVGALSTFYADKGLATYDFRFLRENAKRKYWIMVDEFQKELGERDQGDLAYQFINAIHNKVRNTKYRLRVLLMCNNLRESSDILSGCFNFMPIKYGLYKLHKKKAIIHYYKPEESYWKMMKNGVSDLLASDDDTTFTNEFKHDMELITKQRLKKPSYIIKFDNSKDNWFTVWDGNVIKKWKNQNIKQYIAMTRYSDMVFDKKAYNMIFDMFDNREFKFASLMDKTQFQMYLKKLKKK